MISKSEQIVRIRAENPIIRLTKIADEVGVDKAYVHRVLKKAELSTRSILIAKKNLPKRIDCRACGEDIPKSATHSERVHHIHDECRYEHFYIPVTCDFCQFTFLRRSWHISNATSEYRYCSKKCLYKSWKDKSTYDLRLGAQIKKARGESPEIDSPALI